MPPALFFFLKIALAILSVLLFHINFRMICSISVRNVMGILGSVAILPILILHIQEHRIPFHFFE